MLFLLVFIIKISHGQIWTWIKGSSLTNQGSTYGSIGEEGLSYSPGARYNAFMVYNSLNNSILLFGGSSGLYFGRMVHLITKQKVLHY